LCSEVNRIAVDPLFPPPDEFSSKKGALSNLCPENNFELIYDSRDDGMATTRESTTASSTVMANIPLHKLPELEEDKKQIEKKKKKTNGSQSKA
jgi:hypothetical protein